MTDTATGVLREEHQVILEVVDVLDRVLREADSPSSLPLDLIDRCITFFRLFADACHHGKEEDLLFPELIAHGMPGDAGPIAVMLAEHAQGRLYVRGMAEAMEGARSGNGESIESLVANARNFIGLIRAHIGKEDFVLFTMADDMVVGPECASLCQSYEATCARRFEGKTKEDLEKLAAAITVG
jgi:hemerythrin-like domain-containing protein